MVTKNRYFLEKISTILAGACILTGCKTCFQDVDGENKETMIMISSCIDLSDEDIGRRITVTGTCENGRDFAILRLQDRTAIPISDSIQWLPSKLGDTITIEGTLLWHDSFVSTIQGAHYDASDRRWYWDGYRIGNDRFSFLPASIVEGKYFIRSIVWTNNEGHAETVLSPTRSYLEYIEDVKLLDYNQNPVETP